MKITKKTTLLFLLVSMFFNLEAQDFRYPVVARITQTAPYPIYLNEYTNPAQDNFNVQLEVRDNSLPTRQIRLRLWIQGPGFTIQSTPVLQNEQTIELSSGQTYNIPNNQIANYFENHNLLISPQQYATSLEEGTYRFGIEVIDANTGRALSGVQYGIPIWVTVNEPPIFALPENDILQEPLSPQNVNFQWIPRHKNVTDVEYEFTITELNSPNDYVGNYQNLFLSQPPIYTTRTRQTNLNYNYSLPPLIPGRIYAYRVRAIAREGLEEIGIFRNNGFSEIQWFKYDNQLLPPFNEKVVRSGQYDFSVTWEGHENDESYQLFYREKGADWSVKKVAKTSSESGINLHEDILYLLPEGSYEFQLASNASSFYETAYGPVFSYKDSIKPAYDLQPFWFDSTQAYLSWTGYPNHTDFKILYASNIKKDWKELKYDNLDAYTVNADDNSYAAYIPHLDWDSSYLFKVVAYDIDKDSITSTQAYLKYEDREEVKILLEEKSISGNLFWAFLEEEQALGAITGSAQTEWERYTPKNSKTRTKTFIHNNKEVSSSKYPLGLAKVEVFADKDCSVLLKTVAAGSLGSFNISFPAEALRGGLLPEKIYLLVKHDAFGTFKREVNSNSFENSLDIGDWIIPAKTFRLSTKLTGRGKQYSTPAEHLVKVYRRVSSLETAPYAKYENFKSGNFTIERINNEDYFQVAELKPGEFAAGMFYSASKFKQEYLLKIEGPIPYLDKLEFEQITTENGVYEITVPISQSKGKPYIHGDISFENTAFNGEIVKLVITSPSGINASVFSGTSNNYRYELPINAVEKNETYNIDVYFKNNLVESASLQLDKSRLGTRKDFIIRPRPLVAVLALITDSENKAYRRKLVKINGQNYNTNSRGWVSFLAPNNSTAQIEISRTGYVTKTSSLTITSQSMLSSEVNMSSIKKFIQNDLLSLQTNISTDWAPHELFKSSISFHSYEMARSFSLSKNIDAIYSGASVYKIVNDATPLPFELKFKVVDFDTGEPISGVKINENKLDYLGSTGSDGQLAYQSHIGRGSKIFQISPGPDAKDANGLTYAKDEVAYTFPNLSSTATTHTITIKLISGGLIRGRVYENSTTNVIENATVKIDFLGTESEVKTDANGDYIFRFSPTEEENFITLTGQKDSFNDRVVHMATSSTYGLSYTRDIYLKPGAKLDGAQINLSGFGFFDIYGFTLLGLTKFDIDNFIKQAEANKPELKGRLPISGYITDKQGNIYSFEDVEADIELRGFSLLVKPVIKKISLTLFSGELLYADKFPASTTWPIYLSPLSENNTDEGIIHAQSFGLESNKMSDELASIYNNSDLTLFAPRVLESKQKNRGLIYNKNIKGADFSKYLYPIAYSGGEIPVKEIRLFAKSNTTSAPAVGELLSYYNAFANDKKKLSKTFTKDFTTSSKAFVSNNMVFESLTATPQVIELNNLVVLPIMSIPDIHIDLMDIDKLRLAGEEIDEVLIDYSKSPRKLSMGTDIVEAQIEEVYVEKDGVDIVYFTNNAGNKIKAKTESLPEIKYNANGIFYADYKNQKEIVQTAAVLNEVAMFKIPKPAMGPGDRIKITASAEASPDKLGYLEQLFNNEYRFASTAGGTSFTPKFVPNAAAATSSLKLEGIANIYLSPHDYKVKWRFNNEDGSWETELQSWEAHEKSFWGNWVLRPKTISGMSSDVTLKEDQEAEEEGALPEADINQGEINIKYGAAIPLLSNFNVEVTAKWDETLSAFRRQTASGSTNFRIPSVIDIEAGALLFYDDLDKMNGLFLSVRGNLEMMETEISGSGGYVKVKNDIIWGGNLAVNSEAGVGPPTFKMYGLKVGLLYDQKNEAYFIQLATSIGVGKEITIPDELVQYTTDTTGSPNRAAKQATDAGIKDKWKHGANNPLLIGFDEMFIASSGRSAFEPKDHPFTISDAEVTVTFSKTKGTWTITGAAAIGMKGHHLLDGAFLVSNDGFGDWRVFVGIPSFTRAKVGPFLDFTADFQIDFGRSNGQSNFFVMGAAKGDWPVHAIVYLKLSAKVAMGVNAQTNAETLGNSIAAGGSTLSETAAKVVSFMGSSFNDIAEQSIQQRTTFFAAIPPSFVDVNGLFSGIYFGIKASALVGVNKDFENSILAGSARAGIGLELQLGFLKSFGDQQFELRFSASPVVDLGVKARAPVDMILFEYTVNFAKICGAGYKKGEGSDWKWRFLFTLFSFDEVLGAGGADADCNTVGLFYWRPCIYFYFYTDPDNEEFKGGKWVLDTKAKNDFASKTCPIEW